MAGWPCPTTQEPNLRTAVGLWTCRGFRQWKDLEVRVVGWSWEWLCPCGGVLRSDPWNPPKDMPSIRPSEALESAAGYQEALMPGEREIGPLTAELAGF